MADVTAMQNQPMMGIRQHLAGEMLHQRSLRSGYILRVLGQADPVRYAKHMRIDRHGGLIEGHRHHHVGRLSTHAGQALQILQIIGHYPTKVIHQGLGHAQQVLGLVDVEIEQKTR